MGIGRVRSLCLLTLAVLALGCRDGGAAPVPPCVVTTTQAELAGSSLNALEILFVVADGPTMAAEHAWLQHELPRLLEALTSGDANGDGLRDFTPHDRVRLSLIPADPRRVRAAPDDDCAARYPAFLTHRGVYFGPEQSAPGAIANDVGCAIPQAVHAGASVRPVDAARSALEADAPLGGAEQERRSTLTVVVIVTDRDDCSREDDATPVTSVECSLGETPLTPIRSLVESLTGHGPIPDLPPEVVILTGVPEALVDEEARAGVDFHDERSRVDYYSGILTDPRMRPIASPNDPDVLRPVCTRDGADAQPAPRLTRFARDVSPFARLASICDQSLLPVLEHITAFGSHRHGSLCLPRKVPREDDGRVACRVLWELPLPDDVLDGTPTRCDERPFLQRVESTPAGGSVGQVCEVLQLAVRDDADIEALEPGDRSGYGEQGWYYDDFSDALRRDCFPLHAGIGRTDFARIPAGVVERIECFGLEARSSDAGVCNLPRPPRYPDPYVPRHHDLGRSCTLESVPAGGLDDRNVHLELGHPGCGTGVCMAFRLRGDPNPACEPTASLSCDPALDPGCVPFAVCADPEEVPDRVYCSCRCRAPEGEPTCPCLDGFTCVEAVPHGPDTFRGGYCVRDGTF